MHGEERERRAPRVVEALRRARDVPGRREVHREQAREELAARRRILRHDVGRLEPPRCLGPLAAVDEDGARGERSIRIGPELHRAPHRARPVGAPAPDLGLVVEERGREVGEDLPVVQPHVRVRRARDGRALEVPAGEPELLRAGLRRRAVEEERVGEAVEVRVGRLEPLEAVEERRDLGERALLGHVHAVLEQELRPEHVDERGPVTEREHLELPGRRHDDGVLREAHRARVAGEARLREAHDDRTEDGRRREAEGRPARLHSSSAST